MPPALTYGARQRRRSGSWLSAVLGSGRGKPPQTPYLGFARAVTRADRQRASWRPAGNEQEAVDQVGRGILRGPVGRRDGVNLRGPQLAPDEGEGVAEGRQRLGVPAHALGQRPTLGGKLAGP